MIYLVFSWLLHACGLLCLLVEWLILVVVALFSLVLISMRFEDVVVGFVVVALLFGCLGC